MNFFRKTKGPTIDPIHPRISVYGYIRPEDDHWTAICVTLNLVSQGNNPDEAFDNLISSIDSYLQYLLDNYPNNWLEVINAIEPPMDFIDEMNELSAQITVQASSREPMQIQSKDDSDTIIGRTFAETVPTAFAH